ncbi:MAG: hypothetical protein ACRD2X_09140 [Vicinamibacteraceae bacterium]
MSVIVLRASVLGVLLGGGVLFGAGCATRTRAETRPPVAEPLRVPHVPPRVIAAPPEPEASLPTDTVEVAETEAPPPPEADSTRKPPTRSERGDAAAEKPPATKPGQTADAAATKPEGESILGTPETANDKGAERKIREAMRRAAAHLENLNFSTLNDNAKKDYRNAESFLRQAEAALASRNLPLASDQAGKAEKLARGLTERSSDSV